MPQEEVTTPHDNAIPEYYKQLRKDLDCIDSDLPRAQADKAIGAMIRYYFYREEPKRLPKHAQLWFDSQRHRIDKYRQNVLNGMKNESKQKDG